MTDLSSHDPVVRFFAFMRERESIRLKKEAGASWPWTQDKILRTYKFTNVKREHDRTSRLLINEFYKPNFNAPREQLLLNCAIARYFGTIDFMRAVDWQTDFRPSFLKRIARERMNKNETVWTGAYIITAGGVKQPKEEVVVDGFLTELWQERKKLLYYQTDRFQSIPWTNWQPFIETLKTISGFGGSGFMAKEVTLDTRYTSFWPPDTPEDKFTWTPIGPGSARGAARINGIDTGERATPQLTQETCLDLFRRRRRYLPKGFIELELHDIQFQLCEFDKYERTRLKQGRPRSTYSPVSQGSFL